MVPSGVWSGVVGVVLSGEVLEAPVKGYMGPIKRFLGVHPIVVRARAKPQRSDVTKDATIQMKLAYRRRSSSR